SWIEIRARFVQRRRRTRETLREQREPLLHRRVLARHAVVRAARDRAWVQAGVAAPAFEGEERPFATQLREHEVAVDLLRGREPFARPFHAREPLLGEGAPRGETVSAEITKLVIVRVHTRDGGRDGIEREAV